MKCGTDVCGCVSTQKRVMADEGGRWGTLWGGLSAEEYLSTQELILAPAGPWPWGGLSPGGCCI